MNKFSQQVLLKRVQSIKFPPLDGLFWIISLSDIEEKEILECTKSIDERILNHISELAFLEDRNRSLVAHTIVKIILTEHLGEAPVILRDKFGKPYLQQGNCHFNLSHTKEWAFLGIHSRPIGVDIEAKNTPIESDFWVSIQEKSIMKDRDLITLWCAKEALLKAIGLGFIGQIPEFNEIIEFDQEVLLFKAAKLEVFVYLQKLENQVLAICMQ